MSKEYKVKEINYQNEQAIEGWLNFMAHTSNRWSIKMSFHVGEKFYIILERELI